MSLGNWMLAYRPTQPAKRDSVSANTIVPQTISSSEANSSGRWLNPLRHGMKSMPVGAMRDMNRES